MKKSVMIFFLLGLFIVLMMGGVEGAIIIWAKDGTSGGNVAGARVQMKLAGLILGDNTTGFDGKASFNLATQQYDLEITKEGYATKTDRRSFGDATYSYNLARQCYDEDRLPDPYGITTHRQYKNASRVIYGGGIYNDYCENFGGKIIEQSCTDANTRYSNPLPNTCENSNYLCSGTTSESSGSPAYCRHICSDSDYTTVNSRPTSSHPSIFEEGTITFQEFSGQALQNSKDACVGDKIREYYCSSVFEEDSEDVSCPFGTCQNGACPKCIDSDGGNVPNVNGTTINSTNTQKDNCDDHDSIREYFCSADGTRISWSSQTCASGRECAENSQGDRCVLSTDLTNRICVGGNLYKAALIDGSFFRDYDLLQTCSNGCDSDSNDDGTLGDAVCLSQCSDEDGDGYISGSTAISSCGNVCGPQHIATCLGNNDCEPNNINVNPGVTEPACDADVIDNDCAGGDAQSCGGCTPNCAGRVCGPDPSCGQSCGTCSSGSCNAEGQCVASPICTNGQTRACSNQEGVCSGSQETCTNSAWPGCDYSSIDDYESTESSCADDLDNDCDGDTDNEDDNCEETPDECSSYNTCEEITTSENECENRCGPSVSRNQNIQLGLGKVEPIYCEWVSGECEFRGADSGTGEICVIETLAYSCVGDEATTDLTYTDSCDPQCDQAGETCPKGEVPCPNIVELPFFNAVNFAITLALIALIYAFTIKKSLSFVWTFGCSRFKTSLKNLDIRKKE